MKKIKVVLTVFLGSLALSNCATQIPKNYKFDENHKEGLVVIGIKSLSGPYSLRFRKIDPDTCHTINWAAFGDKKFDNSLSSNTENKHYIIDTFEPGTWVVGGAEYTTGYMSSLIIDYSAGTLAFTVKPGEFIHVGDITISHYGAKLDRPDTQNLHDFLKKFPNVAAKTKSLNPWITPYGPNKEKNVLGCVSLRDKEENG